MRASGRSRCPFNRGGATARGSASGRSPAFPDRLMVRTGALASRVLLDADDVYRPRRGRVPRPAPRLRRRSARRSGRAGRRSAGAGAPRGRPRRRCLQYPATLKLSGIGPPGRAEPLRHPRAGAPAGGWGEPAGPLRGQSRERHAAAISRCCAGSPSATAPGETPDRAYVAGSEGGVYTTNGALLGIVRRSRLGRPAPTCSSSGCRRASPAISRATRRSWASTPTSSRGRC